MIKDKIILVLCILQIILLVNFCVAQGYNINSSGQIINNEINEFSKKIIKSSLNLLIGFLSIKQIGFVSAGCCEETKEGAFCQEVTSGDECSSGSSYSPTSCVYTNFCKIGWCIDVGGLCSESPQILCGEGQWSSNKPEICTEGCCDLGPNTQFREQSWCDVQGGTFDATKSRTACRYISSDLEGACVYQIGEEKTCEFNTEAECNKIVGSKFHEGFLCSHPSFEADCEKQQTINCEDGKIYWFDFCGNRENVYEGNSESEKIESWNGGVVKEKGAEVCSVDLTNKNSLESCGNCDRATSICKQTGIGEISVDEDNFVCADLGCDEDGDGKNEWQNGESWCVYEGQVGEYSKEGVSVSSDIPGSSHYKKECNQGEITIDNCDIYRTQICAENTTQVNGVDFSRAKCRPNLGRTCFEIDDKDECKAEPDCRIQIVDVTGDAQFAESEALTEEWWRMAGLSDAIKDSDLVDFLSVKGLPGSSLFGEESTVIDNIDIFYFEACVPKYPIGFNPSSKSGWNNAEEICELASVDCPVLQQYQAKCVSRDPIFGSCIILEKVYLDYIANKECEKNKDRFYQQMNDFCVSLGDCAGYINTVGNYTGRNSLRTRYEGLNNAAKDDSSNDLPKYFGILSSISAPYEIVLNLIADQRGEIVCTELTEEGVCEETLGEQGKSLLNFRKMSKTLGTISSLAAIAINPYAIIGAIVALLIEVVVFQWQGGGKVGQIEADEIRFSCEPWEPPRQSQDCDQCNEGDLPCTEYKCWSLGKNCGVLPQDSVTEDEPICVQTDADPAAPVIEFESVEGGFIGTETTHGVSITNNSKVGEWAGCISGGTLIDFNLITDKDEPNKFARCRWGYEMANYNEYKDIWTGKSNSGIKWTKEHNFTIRLPYHENKYVDENGNFNLYLRCEGNQEYANINEYIVNFCVEPTPDILPPIIERFEPGNDGYLRYGAISLANLKLYTDEPVESCKYSFTNNVLYENMIEDLYCFDSDVPQIEYECNFGEIFGLTEQENKIYFKCNDTHGNLMSTYTEYTISPSLGELKISSTNPSGYYQVSSVDETYAVNLEVMTSGGGDGYGISRCYWNFSWIEYDSFADNREHLFFNTDSTIHNQELNLRSGNYNIPIRCEDDFDNEAHEIIEFELDIDNIAPEIATIYRSGNSLVVTTHKESRCYYNNEGLSCNVDINNVSALMNPKSDLSIVHDVPWDSDKTYHVQCIDKLNNVGTCVSIVPSIF
jgi:hypothetical protein